MVGGIIASTFGFVVSRWIAQDWVRKRLPTKLLKWDRRLSERAFLSVVVLRLITGYAPAADWVLGISKIQMRDFLLGTAIGLVPIPAVLAIFGDDTVKWIQTAPLAALGIIAALGGIFFLWKKLKPAEAKT